MSLLVFLILVHVVAAKLPVCKEGEFRYEFTECDSAGGRWRVAVPRKPNECQTDELHSTRQKDCTSTCDPGKYLDVNSPDQKCKACAIGHYSLGGDVSYINWTTIPSGFETQSFDDSYSEWSTKKKKGNCTNSSLWKAKGMYLVSGYDACTSQLTLAITLKKDGSVTFTYQSSSADVMFSVYVRNEQCMMSTGDHAYMYPSRTKHFQWGNATVNLKRGHNVISWQTALFPSNDERHRDREPVLIKSIKVHGVAYASECTPCPAGTYSKKVATKMCTPCLADYYSSEKATECKKCDTKTEYSRPGSSSCSKRKPCTVNDYIEIHSQCDGKNKFKKMFQWIEPKICRDDVNGATSLPVSGQEEDCPPCNPGMFMNGTTCQFCPPMTYGDGTGKECTACPATTEPDYGFDFHWWRSWPSNTEHMCRSSYTRGCASDKGFQLHGNYIDSGSGHADDARVFLALETEGFKKSNLSPGLGKVFFEFEMECGGPCNLRFGQIADKESDAYDTLKQWHGKQRKQKFSFAVSSQNIKGFFWVFAKGGNANQRIDEYEEDHYKYRNDKVKIYAIKVTKTVDGGAAKCQHCPVGVKEEGCIPCPKGNRIISDKSDKPTCEPCPANTYLNLTNPHGEKACIPCGHGLHSGKGSTECVSSCQFTSKDGKSFNFMPFSGLHDVKTSALFTTKGTKYYHNFKISLCQEEPSARASCHSNISAVRGYGVDQTYNSSVCRLTIIPRNGEKALAAQPMSVGDQLMEIKSRKLTTQDEMLGSEYIENSTVVSYHYKANDLTEACPEGRSTVVHFVCDPHSKEVKKGVPAKCSEGTCDGCKFHFIIHSSAACPLCTRRDYEKVVTGCVKGKKNMTFVWKMPRLCEGGVKLPKRNSTTCSILERSVGDFVVIGLPCFAGFVVLMILAVLILWYKNRRLEYKYHKLIQNSSDRSGELPGAPQCVGDDDDDEDEVHFKGSGHEGRGKRFLKNIKNKFSGEGKLSEQYNFNNFSDDDTIGSIEPSAKTPLS